MYINSHTNLYDLFQNIYKRRECLHFVHIRTDELSPIKLEFKRRASERRKRYGDRVSYSMTGNVPETRRDHPMFFGTVSCFHVPGYHQRHSVSSGGSPSAHATGECHFSIHPAPVDRTVCGAFPLFPRTVSPLEKDKIHPMSDVGTQFLQLQFL